MVNKTLKVKLSTPIEASVNVLINSGNTNEVTLNVNKLEFNQNNWNIEQDLIITGIDDSVIDGTKNVKISFSSEEVQAERDTTWDKVTREIDVINFEPNQIVLSNIPNDSERIIKPMDL